MTSKRWCFTLNNYTDEEEVKLKDILETISVYYVIGREIGDLGTPHLQGYVVLKKNARLTGLKKVSERAHWEIAKGSSVQNIIYCEKEGESYDWGVRPMSNKEKGETEKDRWSRMVEQATCGDLQDLKEENPREYVLYLNKWRSLDNSKPECLDGVCGLWIYGPTGTGKSHAVFSQHPKCYQKQLNKWWDGYEKEEVVWIDEISPDHSQWIGSYLKIWADKFPFRAEVKGGSKMIRPKKIVITSNYSIDEMGLCLQDLEPIKRRFKEVKKEEKQQMIII